MKPGSTGDLEVDRDALLLPIAVARRIQSILFTGGGFVRAFQFGFGHGRRGAEIIRGIEVLGPLHALRDGA